VLYPNPFDGILIYNTTVNGFQGYSEGAWRNFGQVMGGAGLTESFEDGDVTVSVGAGAGITVAADTVAVTGAAALTDGYLPNWDNATDGFENSPLYTDGANIGLGLITPANLFHVFANNATDLLETLDAQQIIVEQAGAGDPGIGFEMAGGTRFTIGIDATTSTFTVYEGPERVLRGYHNVGGCRVTLGDDSGQDIELEFDATANNGLITWLEDEDYFNFADNVSIGATAWDATGTNQLAIGNGTSPGAADANQIYIGSRDSTDATATLSLYTEQVVEAGAPTIANKFKIRINGTEYWIGLDPV
jgi:hypothetical protein